MRPGTDACPVGTRGAAVAGLASRQDRVPRASARPRRGAATQVALYSQIGRGCFPLAATATRSRPAANNNSCLYEMLCRGRRVGDAEWLSHVVGLRCGRLRCAWGRLPIGIEIIFGPALPPCGTVGLPGRPTVLKVKRRAALGGFSVCWSLFRSLVPRVRALFLKPIFERA